jgi:undecaprenyl-diphosphatase
VAEDRTADAGALILALLGSAGINKVLKETIKRPRPLLKLPLPRSSFSGYSFPSDHATMSIATYGMIAVLLTRRLRAARKGNQGERYAEGKARETARSRAIAAIPAAAIVLCALIGLSRVYQGVHIPSDVLGGWLAGGVWLAACSVASRNA